MANDRKPRFATEQEYDQRLIEVARVTRVMAGGKRMRFRAALVIGDRKGVVGFGLAKGIDVTIAIQKAFNQAKKNLIKIQFAKGTIKHKVANKFGAASVLMKPAKAGEGLKAGGAMRSVLELVGIQDITAKSLGSNNKVNVIKATMNALSSLQGTTKVTAGSAHREGGRREDGKRDGKRFDRRPRGEGGAKPARGGNRPPRPGFKPAGAPKPAPITKPTKA